MRNPFPFRRSTLLVTMTVLLIVTLTTGTALAVQGPDAPEGPPPASGAVGLEVLGRYQAVGAEISAFDPASQRVFVTAAADAATEDPVGLLQILDISNPTAPALVATVNLSDTLGSAPNSVAVYDGLVAVALEDFDDPQADGMVGFFDINGTLITTYPTGAMPDMITFTDDGSKVLTANEGEPGDDVDPEGSITIIDLSAGVTNATAATADFTAFNGREDELRARGVRIFPDKSTAEDVEPEYIAISPDGSTAFVTLQEANAFAVVDIASATVEDILPLGLKDHSRGVIDLQEYPFTDLPPLGVTPAGQTIDLGGFSGLWFVGMNAANGAYQFVTVPDRGPNGAPTDVDGDGQDERPFALPDYQARVVSFELDSVTGEITITGQQMLTRSDGVTPISGLPNIPGADEEPVDLSGNALPYDALGADMEGIVIAPDGSYWMVDEYRPAIYHFAAGGALIDRFVPDGTAALAGQPVGTFGSETLPAEYATRRPNRGFEGMALDSDSGILYAFIQTPLANPDTAASNASDVIRMLGIDPATGQPVAEYVYLLEGVDYRASKVDKIGDAVYAGNGQFYTLERDSSTDAYAKKYIFRVDLAGATNLLDPAAPPLLPGKTLEQHAPDELAAQGIGVVNKVKVANLPSIGYRAGDKTEGLAVLPDGRLAVLNDNDFGLLDEPIPGNGSVPLNPNPTPAVLGIVSFGDGNRLDASDRDGGINIKRWPVYGAYMPDAVSSFEVNGATFYVTANEGDTRNEDERVKDLVLDTTAFPNAGWLQQDANIGRLTVSSIDGDIDNDGSYEQLWAYGARSFSVWDEYGNLVYDSSDDMEQTTAAVVPEIFNSDGDADSFDSRSDNKGPEPEGVDTGEVNGRTFAFVGMERTGGIAVYDVTTPYAPLFASYTPQPAGDLSPEGILFVPLADSPANTPVLIVSNEVSGTVTVYAVQSYDPGVMRSRRYDVSMDTFINGTQPAGNFDAAQTMWVGFFDQMRPLASAHVPVCNNPSACVPPDSQIDAAYLYLYVTEGRGFSTWAGSLANLSVHGLNTGWQQETATWSFPWTTAGGDFGPALNTVQIGSGRVGTWVRFDVTEAVAQSLLSGQQFGFVLTSDDSTGVRYGLATQDYFDPSRTGYLRVMFHSYRSPATSPLASEQLK